MKSGLKGIRVSLRVTCATVVAGLAMPTLANAGMPPEIRLNATNQVPACVTPERLMTFLKTRNGHLDPRFKDIATFYRQHGENLSVRWDYAFYQMAVETNFLSYKRPNGQWGDVDPKQNNFAGIGTTGGGVPGDKFPDVKTGVLGQIQHLIAYSGERQANPVAARTQLKQDDIIVESLKLNRPVRFSDLARRWAVDPRYGSSIEWVADAYRSEHCKGKEPQKVQAKAQATETLPWTQSPTARVAAIKPSAAAGPAPVPANDPVRTVWVSSPRGEKKVPAEGTAAPPQRPAVPATLLLAAAPAAEPTAAEPLANAAPEKQNFNPVATPPSGLGAKPSLAAEAASTSAATPPACSVTGASYGGKKTVLIRAEENGVARYTALTVLDGFEKSMTATFIKNRAPGGEALGEFADQASAIAKARELCPAT